MEQVLKGIKSVQVRSRPPSKLARLPITPELQQKMKATLKGGNDAWNSCNAMGCFHPLLFCCFFRSGEITLATEQSFEEGAHLTFDDVSVDHLEDPKVVKVKLKASKTDPFRAGIDIFIGRTNDGLCPVAAVLAYMVVRGPRHGSILQI